MAADPRTHDVVVVGAGAAGLWCAEVAARRGAGVLVLEKTPRTGTKVLASGGTRCNLTTTLGPDAAARLFGRRGERFLRHAFRTLTPADVRERFDRWGVPSDEAPLEKVFPRSGKARDVRDALEGAAHSAGAEIVLDAPATAIQRDGGAWVVRTSEGSAYRGRSLVLAAGGRSYPRTGTTGDAYPWLRALGLEVVEPVPALVPLTSPDPWVRELTGLAWQGGEVRLENADGRVLERRRRPVLFTHRGVSGPGAMDVSRVVAREPDAGHRLRIDMFPDLSRDAVRDTLIAAAGRPKPPRVQRVVGALDDEPVPRRLFEALAHLADAPGDVAANALGRAQRHALVETLKGAPIRVDGTVGWDHAEVTAGGLALRAVDPRSMRVNAVEGLFVIGELLDVDGPIGGLSFQAAFATAELAGVAVGR